MARVRYNVSQDLSFREEAKVLQILLVIQY